jgi:hypothetical protein
MPFSLKMKLTLIWKYNMEYIPQIGQYAATIMVHGSSYSLWFKSSQARAVMAVDIGSGDMLHIEGELIVYVLYIGVEANKIYDIT